MICADYAERNVRMRRVERCETVWRARRQKWIPKFDITSGHQEWYCWKKLGGTKPTASKRDGRDYETPERTRLVTQKKKRQKKEEAALESDVGISEAEGAAAERGRQGEAQEAKLGNEKEGESAQKRADAYAESSR